MTKLIDCSQYTLSTSPQSYQSALEEIADDLDLHYIGCFFETKKTTYFATNLPENFNRDYIEMNVHEKNILHKFARQTSLPLEWNRFRDHPDYKEYTNRLRMMNHPENGIIIPVHGTRENEIFFLTVSKHGTDCSWDRFISLNLGKIVLLASKLAAAFKLDTCNIFSADDILPPTELSENEIIALESLLPNAPQTHRYHRQSPCRLTHQTHLKTARHKLNAITDLHAVAKALHYNLIETYCDLNKKSKTA